MRVAKGNSRSSMDFAQRILKILEILLWPLLVSLVVASSTSKLALANPVDGTDHNSIYHSRKSDSSYGGVSTEPRPHFAGRIENVTVNIGREAVLECPVNHLGRYKVGWLKAKDQTILALHHRVITHNTRFDVDHDDNRIWKLKIRTVQEADAGCYMCQINTEVMKKQIGCIDVLIPPEIDDLKTSSDVHVNEGEEATLECRANGHPRPEIKWLREDKANFTIYDKSNKRMTVNEFHGEVLRLKRVQRHQMGAYLCIASNSVPPSVSKRIRLNVNFAPEITVSDQLHGVGPGANVTVKCKVEAHPTAINYWMKDQAEMLLDGPKYEINEEIINEYQRVMRLTIKNWQKIDESHFTCISTNSLGKADGKIQAYTYIQRPDPEDVLNRDPLPTPEYFDSSRGQEPEHLGATDDVTYHSNNGDEPKRISRKKVRNKEEDYRYNSDSTGPNGTPQKSSFGSSFFSNSSSSSTIGQNNTLIHLILLLQLAVGSQSSFSSFAISC